MALGDLSTDQARYRDRIAAGTGLDARVVTAWIGTESGWGVTKTSHNYLNIGPGRTYANVDQAANAAVSLITTSDRYRGIRASVPAGPAAQVAAIGDSPWGTSASLLTRVYGQLAGANTGETPAATPVGLRIPGTGVEIPNPLDPFGLSDGLADTIVNAVVGVASKLLGPVFELLLETGLRVAFSVAGLGLVALGLNRLTGSTVRERFEQVASLAGTAGAARGAAAAAA